MEIFLQHLLPLPFFLTLAPNIYDHWNFALASEPLRLSVIGVYMPSLIVYLIGNVLTQYPFLNTTILYYIHACVSTYINISDEYTITYSKYSP